MTSAIVDKYNQRAREIGSLLCVGLDSDLNRIAEPFRSSEYPRFAFNQWIIRETHQFVSAYKVNVAFYENGGEQGIHELYLTMDYLRQNHPGIFTICDAKRADIANTNNGYVTAIFDNMGFDAVTLHPYLGHEALEPFLSRSDKGCLILCRTSNRGAGELQDLMVDGEPLWQVVAQRVATQWNTRGNCMLVVGATYPSELRRVREITGEMTLLVPGIGTQGGDVETVVKAGLNKAGLGLIISASRSIIFADDPGDCANALMTSINRYRTL
jgi:orotidine-5'-phosphate decarboxylase